MSRHVKSALVLSLGLAVSGSLGLATTLRAQGTIPTAQTDKGTPQDTSALQSDLSTDTSQASQATPSSPSTSSVTSGNGGTVIFAWEWDSPLPMPTTFQVVLSSMVPSSGASHSPSSPNGVTGSTQVPLTLLADTQCPQDSGSTKTGQTHCGSIACPAPGAYMAVLIGTTQVSSPSNATSFGIGPGPGCPLIDFLQAMPMAQTPTGTPSPLPQTANVDTSTPAPGQSSGGVPAPTNSTPGQNTTAQGSLTEPPAPLPPDQLQATGPITKADLEQFFAKNENTYKAALAAIEKLPPSIDPKLIDTLKQAAFDQALQAWDMGDREWQLLSGQQTASATTPPSGTSPASSMTMPASSTTPPPPGSTQANATPAGATASPGSTVPPPSITPPTTGSVGTTPAPAGTTMTSSSIPATPPNTSTPIPAINTPPAGAGTTTTASTPNTPSTTPSVQPSGTMQTASTPASVDSPAPTAQFQAQTIQLPNGLGTLKVTSMPTANGETFTFALEATKMVSTPLIAPTTGATGTPAPMTTLPSTPSAGQATAPTTTTTTAAATP